jgi:hypothetical protein
VNTPTSQQCRRNTSPDQSFAACSAYKVDRCDAAAIASRQRCGLGMHVSSGSPAAHSSSLALTLPRQCLGIMLLVHAAAVEPGQQCVANALHTAYCCCCLVWLTAASKRPAALRLSGPDAGVGNGAAESSSSTPRRYSARGLLLALQDAASQSTLHTTNDRSRRGSHEDEGELGR